MDNRETLAWLDHARRGACDGKREKIEDLLTTVRAEILFEMSLADGKLDGSTP